MRKTLQIFLILFIVIFNSINTFGQNKYKLIRYKYLDAGKWGDFLGSKRTQFDIEVKENIKDEEIKEILEQAVIELSELRDVDAISVRLYIENTNLPYAIADWAPYGNWNKAETGIPKSVFKTSITFYPEHKGKESSKEKKYGLSLEQRKIIYHEVCQSQKNTRQIAEKKYPSDIMKQYDYMDELDDKYESEICRKYFITDDQKCKIVDEGVENNWSE